MGFEKYPYTNMDDKNITRHRQIANEVPYISDIVNNDPTKERQKKMTEGMIWKNNIPYPQWDMKRKYAAGLSLFLFLVKSIIVTARLIFDDEHDYFLFMTNWSFFFGVLFYGATLIGFYDDSGTVMHYILILFFWVYLVTVANVFYLVNFVLFESPNLLLDEIHRHYAGLVFLGNSVVHVLPYVAILIWMFLMIEDIKTALKRFPWMDGEKIWFILYNIFIFFASQCVIICYALIHNYKKVYNVDYPLSISILVMEVIVFFHSVFIIVNLSPYNKLQRKPMKEHVNQAKV